VVQYFASSEEALSYGCMRPVFSMSSDRLEVSMNFTYTFTDDPAAELLYGNITWEIPNPHRPSHWVHAEDTCKSGCEEDELNSNQDMRSVAERNLKHSVYSYT
jgi:hypothetical protein